MEYLGLLPLGAAVIGLGLRSYFSMMTADTEQADKPRRQRNSAKAKRTMEKAIVRRLLRYHRGLVHA